MQDKKDNNENNDIKNNNESKNKENTNKKTNSYCDEIENLINHSPENKDEETINRSKEYDKKNKRTKNTLIFCIIFILINTIFNITMNYLFTKEINKIQNENNATQENNNNENIEIIKNLYEITTYTGNYLSIYKTNKYTIDNGLLCIEKINSDQTTSNVKINTMYFSIKYNDYIIKDDFAPQYYIKYYNGTHTLYYYASNIEINENNEIIIITDKGKFHLKGTYEIISLTNEEIKNWAEKYKNKEQNIEK